MFVGSFLYAHYPRIYTERDDTRLYGFVEDGFLVRETDIGTLDYTHLSR